MVNHHRLTRPFAAALGLAAALWMLPASAVENSDVSGAAAKAGAEMPAAATVKTGGETPRAAATAAKSETARPAAERPRHVRHEPRRRVVTPYPYYERRIREVYSRECSGVWCGRPFVLLIGVGF